MNRNILINCSNLHNGGGVAVASSVIDCLSRMDHGGLNIYLLLSTSVQRNLLEMGTDLSVFSGCTTHDFHGLSTLLGGLNRYFKGMDLVFTVFGPAYFPVKHNLHLFGFAQPNIIYPTNPVAVQQGLLDQCRTRAKFEMQAWFFSRADAIVVELEHVQTALTTRRLFCHKPIHVVYSSVHSVFKQPEKWAPLKMPERAGCLKLGIISRNYPHKNLAILEVVKARLMAEYGRDVDFYVTFQPDEWAACGTNFRDKIFNVGGLSLSQCPTFYAAMDGVVFPSLLECFSAVPIETMMLKRPLFASNLSFIKDVCANHCNYFDPLDAADIARVIDSHFNKPDAVQQQLCEAAYAHVQRYPGPAARALNYLNLIKSMLN